MSVQQLTSVLTPVPGTIIYILVVADVIQLRYYIFTLLNWALIVSLLFVLFSNYSAMRVRTQRTTDTDSKDGAAPLDKTRPVSSLVPGAATIGSHVSNPGSQVQPHITDVSLPVTDEE